MKPHKIDNSPEVSHLQHLLRHHETSLRLSDSARLLVKGIAALAGLALLIVAMDHTFSAGLSGVALRAADVLLAILGISLVVLLGRTAARHVNAQFVARDLERSRGVAHNAVLNWLLVRDAHKTQYAVPTGAVQAEAELSEPTGEVSSQKINRLHWTALATVIAAWLIFAVVTPKEIAPSLRRLLGSSEQAPSATQIVMISPTAEKAIYVGEPLTLEFEIRGKSAEALSFDLVDPGASDSRPLVRHTLPRAAPRGKPDLRSITLTGNEIATDLCFRARAGDGELAGRIPVRPIPDVAGYQIEITPPKYLGLPSSQTKTPDLHANAGSDASWQVRANCEVHNPVFVFKGATEIRTRMSVTSSDPRMTEISMPLAESGSYWIEFSDRWGRSTPRGAAHRIVLQGDQAPRVELVEPTPAARVADTVDLADVAWLRVAASDDWQLRSLELVLERAGVIERRDLSITKTKPGEVVQVGVAGSEIDLAVGQSLKAWFEARDNRQAADGHPASQLGRSPTLTLRRSAMSAIERGGKKAEPEVAQADSGTVVETASSKRKMSGNGSGNDDTATGDGSGDNPSNKSGPEGGSARPSEKGNSATTDQPSDPSNSATVGTETGADQPGGGDSDDNTQKGASEKGDKGENGKGDGEGDGEGKGDGAGTGGENAPLENELKKFIERHGDEVKQAKEALDRKQSQSGNVESSSPPRERETSDEKPADNDSEPKDSQPPTPEDNSNPVQRKQDSQEQAGSPQGEAKKEGQPADQGQQKEKAKEDTGKPSDKEGQPDPNSSGQKESNEQNNKSDQDSKGASQKKNNQESSNQENAGSEKNDKAGDESKDGKTPGKDGEAQKPQPNAPANDKSKPDSPEPEAGKSEQPDSANPQAGEKGDPAGGPANKDLPDDQRNSTRGAAPGSVSLPGAKAPPDPGDGPGAPMQEDGPISKQSGDAKPNQPRSEIQNLLELLERSEAIGPEALDDMPWPTDKKAAFLRDLKRLDSLAKLSSNQAALQRWREGKPFGTREVQYGRGTGVIGDVGESTMQADSIDKLANPPDQKVPPHLRPVLDAYYRSLANKRAASPKP